MRKKRNPGKAADRRLQKKYGITSVEYDAMLTAQGGGCAICGYVPTAKVRYVAVCGKKRRHGVTEKVAIKRLRKVIGKKGLVTVKRITVLVRLSVDHSHKFRYMKVASTRIRKGKWWAWCKPFGVRAKGKTRSEVVRSVRAQLKRKSVRGILCFPCNGGLRKYKDKWELLASASEYLKKFQRRKNENQQGILLGSEPHLI